MPMIQQTENQSLVTFFLFKGAAISWGSRKQTKIATSTCEAEYNALADACQELCYLRSLAFEIDSDIVKNPTKIYVDNKAVIKLANKNSSNFKSRFIDISFHFVKEMIDNKELILEYLNTNEMIADSLTKALPINKHKFCTNGMGLLNNN